jgi:HK97 family phage prohead protease
MKRKLLDFENCSVKVNATGNGPVQFQGYASVFNGLDAYNDTIEPGAFAGSLEMRDRPVRMRWNHYGPVIGKWLEIKEDDRGLFVRGELTPGHTTARNVGASLRHGAVDGLSIGYQIVDAEQRGDVQALKEIELIEVSVVEEPADAAALVSEVKSSIENAATLKELEAILRDAGGFSRSSAAAFISRVKGCLGDPEQASKDEVVVVSQKDIDNLIDHLAVNLKLKE